MGNHTQRITEERNGKYKIDVSDVNEFTLSPSDF